MSTWNLAAALWLGLAQFVGGSANAEPGDDYRLSGPAVHGNLAIYFVHGKSRGGPIPLTLQEALAKKTIEVREIGQVNELQVENTGGEEIFIQAGDIVKGGQQDRVLSVSLVLKPHSGPLKIASFCVEPGRWSARGGEDVQKFSSANASLPSRTAKIEMAGAALPKIDGADAASVSSRQREIWKSVTEIQGKLANNLGAPVAAPPSRTSLQLALENGGLERAQTNTSRRCSRSAKRRPTSWVTCSRSTARSTAPTSIPQTACSGRCGPSCCAPARPRRSASATASPRRRRRSRTRTVSS